MCAKWILFKKKCERILSACSMLFLFGCTETIYFYPPDKSQCITVVTENWTDLRDLIDGKPNRSIRVRYIMAGRHVRVPEKNFVKLDIDSGDRYRTGFYICWKNEQYDWEVAFDYARVIESTLDTTRFNFMTEFPKDDRGFPTAIKFTKEGCDVYSFELKRLIPEEGGTIVEYK